MMTTSNGYVTREKVRFVRTYKDIDLPDGSKARIQNLSNREKEELQYALLGKDGKPDYRAAIVGQQARLLQAAWVDGEGQKLFEEHETDVIQDEIDPDIIDVLSDAIIAHCGINESGIERLKKRFNDTRDSNLPTN